jgi:hypothetical protein
MRLVLNLSAWPVFFGRGTFPELHFRLPRESAVQPVDEPGIEPDVDVHILCLWQATFS